MPKKIKSQPSATAVQTAAPPTESALATHATRATRAAHRSPRNHRELAQAIFEGYDAVTVGRELLGPNNERVNNSVKARIWETLVDFLFGKPPASGGASSSGPNVQIVWDLPAPPHEAHKR